MVFVPVFFQSRPRWHSAWRVPAGHGRRRFVPRRAPARRPRAAQGDQLSSPIVLLEPRRVGRGPSTKARRGAPVAGQIGPSTYGPRGEVRERPREPHPIVVDHDDPGPGVRRPQGSASFSPPVRPPSVTAATPPTTLAAEVSRHDPRRRADPTELDCRRHHDVGDDDGDDDDDGDEAHRQPPRRRSHPLVVAPSVVATTTAPAATLTAGSPSAEVAELQRQLNAVTGSTLAVDGLYRRRNHRRGEELPDHDRRRSDRRG